jgi:hypothetical protein
MHKNAQLTPLGRERIVRQVESGQPNDEAEDFFLATSVARKPQPCNTLDRAIVRPRTGRPPQPRKGSRGRRRTPTTPSSIALLNAA